MRVIDFILLLQIIWLSWRWYHVIVAAFCHYVLKRACLLWYFARYERLIVRLFQLSEHICLFIIEGPGVYCWIIEFRKFGHACTWGTAVLMAGVWRVRFLILRLLGSTHIHWFQPATFWKGWCSSAFHYSLLELLNFCSISFELFNWVNSWILLAQLNVEASVLLVDLLQSFPLVDSRSGFGKRIPYRRNRLRCNWLVLETLLIKCQLLVLDVLLLRWCECWLIVLTLTDLRHHL